MKLITVEASFAQSDVAIAVRAVHDQADQVRGMAGCDHYAVYENPTGLAIVHRWHSMDAFDAYRASEAFAALIGALKPLITAPPVTTLATTDILGA